MSLEFVTFVRRELARDVLVDQVVFGRADAIQSVAILEMLALGRGGLFLGGSSKDVAPQLADVPCRGHREPSVGLHAPLEAIAHTLHTAAKRVFRKAQSPCETPAVVDLLPSLGDVIRQHEVPALGGERGKATIEADHQSFVCGLFDRPCGPLGARHALAYRHRMRMPSPFEQHEARDPRA